MLELVKFVLTWIGEHPILFFFTLPFWGLVIIMPIAFVWEVLAGIGNGILKLFGRK